MKLIKSKYFIPFTILAFLFACGGGDGNPPPVLDKGGFNKYLYGELSSSGSESITFSESGYGRTMFLYRNLIRNTGYIKSVKFYSDEPIITGGAGVTCPNTTIRLAHTNAMVFDTSNLIVFSNYVGSGTKAGGRGSVVTVLNNATIHFTDGPAGTEYRINFDTPFNYNGVDNLIIDIERSAACSGTVNLKTNYINNTYTSRISTNVNSPLASYSSPSFALAEYVFEGGDNHVVPFHQTDSGYTIAPGATGRTQLLLYASDIKGNGPITGLAFDKHTAILPSYASRLYMSVKMAHRSSSESLSTTFDDNYDSDIPTVLVENLIFTIPQGARRFWIPLTNYFDYNGVDNLLIDITTVSLDDEFEVIFSGVLGNYNSRIISTPNVSDVSGTEFSGTFRPHLRFHGGQVGVVDQHDTSSDIPFSNTSSAKLQLLYRAIELGTSGKITHISCRSVSDMSTQTSYPNLEIKLGHTDKTSLGSTFADNMIDVQTVYSGNFTIPAGLIKGDWIEIRLQTPFNYNSPNNLVVQFANDLGSISHPCAAKIDARPRFYKGLAYSKDRNAVIAESVEDATYLLRFNFE